ncbi:MAG: FAD-dependent oxidoreductase [Cytophagales bacterium]|nr:FAD-dependent oxidoreductase [Cytophagales bacterium]
MKKVIDILTSFSSPHKVSAIGNEAVARGALEAGVCGVFSYPGTPSTEISEIFNMVNLFKANPENQKESPELLENKTYFEYSINEKVALEKAIAFSICNQSAMCVMKNVGMNVASDPLMSITYQTITAPLVIVVCDDPGCHSSSNEQDSRYWGHMASVPVFNPATPKDAYEMTKRAFQLSADLRLPVIVRTTTRVSHTRGMIEYHDIQSNANEAFFERMPEHINIPARTATAHQKLLDKLGGDTINPFFKEFNRTIFEGGKKKSAIISSGVSTSYLLELIEKYGLSDQLELLDLGLIFPFPEKDMLAFLNKGQERILIVEELDPLVEKAVRNVVQKNKLPHQILGKEETGLSSTGEFSLDQIDKVITEFFEIETAGRQPLDSLDKFTSGLPPRPPALCSGCPHRASYYALKLLVPRDGATNTEEQDIILCGDIGCSGLGALPPLKMIDTINHMGMSVSMGQGISEALSNAAHNANGMPTPKVVAMLGDGTFFHSGVSSLLNAVYTKANMLVIIFDNRTIGMTGHQDHPGATHLEKYHEIDIAPLVRGMGINYVETLMPFDMKDTYRRIEEAIAHEGVAVLISKAPCVFLPDYEEFTRPDSKIVIDHSKCNTCYNHSDHSIHCSKMGGSKANLTRAIAKIKADDVVDSNDQTCPANICNHGFFNSILEKDYSTALDMVRDKLLFSRTCGDICHRPCELFSNNEAGTTVPIKQLKKFVSGIEENFKDFSSSYSQVENAEKKDKHVAVIGAGPAGLSAAFDLIRNGYEVTVFEKAEAPGGLIKFVIPDFRMDKDGFDFEVGQLEKMGVKFQFNTALGQDIQLEDISTSHDAVILALGLGKSNKLEITDKLSSEKRYDAMTFLKEYNLGTLTSVPGSRFLIIGGGNSAIDVARSAKRISQDNEVVLSCIETEENMPAFSEEIVHAKEEGISILANSFVSELSESESVEAVLSTYDSKEKLKTVSCDYVVVAIGQVGDKNDYEGIGENNLSPENRIMADAKTGFTNHSNVFVAGDLCADNHMSLIGAIASGKRAVIGVRQKLEDYAYEYEGLDALLGLNDKVEGATSNPIDLNGKISTFIENFNLFQSCEKCNHCIDNLGCPAMIKVDGKIVIDYGKCTKCGLCIDVCPNDAIGWVKEEVESLEIRDKKKNADVADG